MELEQLYHDYKSSLFGLAYRMLGSVTEAEDIIHDVFLNLHQSDLEKINHVKTYLVKMVTNRCINVLNSARHQKEQYIGPWLPEPLMKDLGKAPDFVAEEKEMISYAFLVLLQYLSPVERAVFILREVLSFEYDEISKIIHKTEVNCRKIYSRARKKLPEKQPSVSSQESGNKQLADAFIHCLQTGNFKPFLHLMLEDARITTDGGGKVRAAIKPIEGRYNILALLEGIYRKGELRGELSTVQLNGEIGLLLTKRNKIVLSICFEFDPIHSGIKNIYMVANPEKLKHLSL
ncbi:RNA polymerase sigma-70 factor [Shimazuella sp. KC615]|uniref:RNA polymerase sigma-70 factor n=2 Tax=Shimazuella alba TaxID=2690964 RepID=A0A6I4VUE3_9BACL|nr:RNA polymerase sigma-70 factor [Shimazuella alba]